MCRKVVRGGAGSLFGSDERVLKDGVGFIYQIMETESDPFFASPSFDGLRGGYLHFFERTK